MLRTKRIALAAGLAAIAACTSDSVTGITEPAPPSGPSEPRLAISDAAHGGREGFYFLPPMVPNPGPFSGTFDPNLAPVVQICVLNNAGTACTGTVVATLNGGSGAEAVTVDLGGQSYNALWQAPHNLALGPKYRLEVYVGSVVVGFADLYVVKNNKEAKNVNNNLYVPLQRGSPFNVKFRIETGTIGTVTVTPARDTVEVGETAGFTATVTDLHGNPILAPTVDWLSTNTAVATVSPATGTSTTATASTTLTAEDSTEIVATSGGVTGSAVLVVLANRAPDAVDDTYSIASGATLSLTDTIAGDDADPSDDALVANDDRGLPLANIDSIGGGDLGGGVNSNHVDPTTGFSVSPLPGHSDGSLSVDRLGRLTFMPPTGFTGNFTFRYLLKNSVGSDSATVTISVDGPPMLVGTSPTGGATGLADSVDIVLTFSEAVTAASGAFAIECPVGTGISFTPTPALDGATSSVSFTLDPDAALPWDTTCRVSLTASLIADVDGTTADNLPADTSFTFTVDAAPTVTSTTPADGADDVLPDADITIDFSESVNATTSSFTIDCGTTQSFSLSSSPSSSFTLDPDNQFPVGSTCTVTVHASGITDADSGDPPDNMAADTSFSFTVPIQAVDDTYPETVTGNLLHNSANISPTPFSVTGNDQYGSPVQISDVNGATTVVSGTITGTSDQGGTVVMTVSGPDLGKLTYDPPRGYEGADQFTYTIQVVSNPSQTATATVQLTVAGMVWFIDAGASSGGDGRFTSPYNTLAGFAAVNDGAGNNPAANDHVFLYESATAYTGPLTLLNGQRLIGQDAAQSLATLTGITPSSGSTPFPATNGANATEVNVTGGGITLAQNNRVHGLRLGTTTGTAIASGAGFGTLTVDDVKILASGAAGLSLNTGTATITLDSLSSSGGTNNVGLTGVGGTLALGTGELSGASSDAFKVSGGGASISYAGSISNGSTLAVNVANKTGGAVTLSGSINPSTAGRGISVSGNGGGTTVTFSGSAKKISTGTGAGVSLSSNTGATVSFGGGGLEVTTTTGKGFSATGGGTVQVTGAGNTLASAGGIALEVQNTTIGAAGLSFRSISANGGANGILLANTGSQGLQVTGNGGSCTIATPTCTGGTIQNTTGAGVSLTNTATVALTHLRVRSAGSHGIHATGSVALSLTSSYLQTNGNGDDENSLNLQDAAGTVSLDATAFNGAAENLVRVSNNNANLTLTIQNGSHFEYPNPKNSAFANSAISVLPRGSSAVSVSVTGSTFKNIVNNSLQFGPDATATGTGTATFTNNTISVDAGLNTLCSSNPECRVGHLSIGGSGGTTNFVATGNTFTRVNGDGVFILGSNASATLRARVENNSISNALDDAFVIGLGQSAREILQINNNTITNIGGDALEVASGETNAAFGTGSASDMDLVFTNNTMTNVGTNPSLAFTGGPGIFRFGDADQELCLAFTGNTVTNSGTGIDVYLDGNFGGLGGNIVYEGAGTGAVTAARVKADNPGVTQANVTVASTVLSNGALCQRPGI